MKIYIADFCFELTSGASKIVKDVVVTRIPNSHIHRKSDIIRRATIGFSAKELIMLVKDKYGRHKLSINYTKIVGQTFN